MKKKLSRQEEGKKLYEELNRICDKFMLHIDEFVCEILKLSGLKGKELRCAKLQATSRFKELVTLSRVSVVEAAKSKWPVDRKN